MDQRHHEPGEEPEASNGYVWHRHILSPDVPARLLLPEGRRIDAREPCDPIPLEQNVGQ